MPETSQPFSHAEDLVLLSQAAKQAGQIALGFFGKDPQVWMKNGDSSPVSEADFAVDNYLKQILLQRRPCYGWISEESTDERSDKIYQRYFVVDPIDGTRGFINKSSQWCISLAIIENGRPICGVLECPVREEHYSAHSAAVAMLNDRPLSEQLLKSGNHTAEPNQVKNSDEKIRLSCVAGVTNFLTQKLPPHLTQRLEFSAYIPSLAYRLALVAARQLDMVVVKPNSHDWDLAAADIILCQSGINLSTPQGKIVLYGCPPFRHGFLLAGREVYHHLIGPYLE